MKKKWVPIVIMGIVLVVLGLGVYMNDYIVNDPSYMSSIDTTKKADNLNYLGNDLENNHYYLYSSNETFEQIGLRLLGLESATTQRYLLKVSQGGKILYRKHLPEELGSVVKVAFDGDQNMYFWTQARDPYGIYVIGEKIIRFDKTSGKDLTIYQANYADPTIPGEGNIRGLSSGKEIFYYYLDENKVYVNRYDGEIHVDRVISWDPDETLIEVLGTTAENTLLLSKSSKVYGLTGSLTAYNVKTELIADFLSSGSTLDSAYFDDKGSIVIETLDIDEELVRSYMFNQKLNMITPKEQHPWQVSTPYQGVIEDVNRLKPESGIVLKAAIVWLMLLGILGIFLYCIYYYYVYVLQQKNPLVMKLLLTAIPIVIIGMIIYIRFNYMNTYVAFKDELESSKYIAFSEAMDDKFREIDDIKGERNALGEMIESYENADHDTQLYSELVALTRLSNGVGTSIEGTYYVIDKVVDGESFKLIDADLSEKVMYPRYVHYFNETFFKKAAAGETLHGKTGSYIFTLKPIYNQKNEVVGIFQVGMNYGNYQREIEEELLYGNLQRLSIITAVMILVMGITIYIILRPIGALTKSVRDLSEENLDFEVQKETNDEIGDLTMAFHYITNTLKDFISRIRKLNKAYYRFVPEEFFHVLDKNSVMDVELGDNRQLNMCIMNASISNYYQVSEQFEKEEHFKYVNKVLSLVAPQIRENLGFVDRYLDRGAVGLFSNRGHHAIQAAIETVNAFYSDDELKDIFKLNIGIHRGDLLMGIIGEQERLQSIVLSDDVTMTSQLQELADYLNISVLVSEEVINSTDEELNASYRPIGKLMMKDRNKAITLIDVYEGDEVQLKHRKSMTLKDFNAGITAYQEGRFYEARTAFVKVLSAVGEDNISKAYFYLSDHYYREGKPEEWDGVLDLNLVRFDLEG